MNILFKTTVLAASLLLVACNDNDDQEAQTAPSTNSSKYYQTKTPYQPQQEIKNYEQAPNGFQPVFTELVARHGSRGYEGINNNLHF